MNRIWIGLVAAALVCPAPAARATDAAGLCEATKLKLSGKYASCRLSRHSKAVKTESSPDFSKCDLAKFGLVEDLAMGLCPTSADETTIESYLDAATDDVATLLAGGSLEPNHVASGQTTSQGAGDDGDVEAGATLSFVDNGDGTITDANTHLMWEKKVGFVGGYTRCENEAGDCANPHDVNNTYPWTALWFTSAYDGPVKTIFLEQLNNRCDKDPSLPCSSNADCAVPGGACGFAGHRDWRLPSVKELAGIVHYGSPYPGPTVTPQYYGIRCVPSLEHGLTECFDNTLPDCSCTQRNGYWTSTTYAYDTVDAWYVSFANGQVDVSQKGSDLYARAVRGGS